jgi:hypothetical protein
VRIHPSGDIRKPLPRLFRSPHLSRVMINTTPGLTLSTTVEGSGCATTIGAKTRRARRRCRSVKTLEQFMKLTPFTLTPDYK